jgi:hypothetical protein
MTGNGSSAQLLSSPAHLRSRAPPLQATRGPPGAPEGGVWARVRHLVVKRPQGIV